ncbi:MBOAT family O-acyltransferase [Neiella litorisoli]|uniref:MBOAT family O-acyltransferase n=1 Tax=Neiella litorisoli TaxID=2771431 RepID=UPI001CD19122|nr:MBOAT family protein [Neiella litorisoli]
MILIIGSMVGNYIVGSLINSAHQTNAKLAKLILTVGVTLNLGLLGYYKYFNFFLDQVSWLTGEDWQVARIALPLAISFFTFQQIAYLVDTYRKEIEEHSFLQYSLFVTFFPQLIAGPIVHHKEMLPQFAQASTFRFNSYHMSVGIVLFSIGLFKKVVLADNVAVYATPIFQAADQGIALTAYEAWIGTLAYTMQLYFDFSGYSDMALGLARMFGIRLPENFNSPYKATSIVDFWRRWHMTLSRFLRDYLYIALGGNRKGPGRRYVNLLLTMLLGGLWHGAGWNFVIWGALHGSYLCINHAWGHFRSSISSAPVLMAERVFYWALTFAAVCFGWIFFRAETLDGALLILVSMANLSTLTQGSPELILAFDALLWCIALLAIAVLMPNSLQLYKSVENILSGEQQIKVPRWQVPAAAVASAFAGLYALSSIGQLSEFLYFNF